jgi:methanogenic corrinoid protein MtbC1
MEFENIYKGILSGNQNGVLDGINTALDSGKDPGEILNTGMITAMGEVGRLFE